MGRPKLLPICEGCPSPRRTQVGMRGQKNRRKLEQDPHQPEREDRQQQRRIGPPIKTKILKIVFFKRTEKKKKKLSFPVFSDFPLILSEESYPSFFYRDSFRSSVIFLGRNPFKRMFYGVGRYFFRKKSFKGMFYGVGREI